MNRSGRVGPRYLRAASLFLIMTVCGCGSGTLPTYMQPERLYLKDRPYSRLYVEVDTIEGVQVPLPWLDELQAFLAEHCDKPDGVTMVRDEPVPRTEITDLPLDLVALACTDGPRTDGAEQPAYLHLVFYDSRMWPHQKTRNPMVPETCPCAVLCDVNYAFKTFKDKLAGGILRHEAGHVLGLCKDREHGDGAHCRKSGCLMRPSPGVVSEVALLAGVPWKKNLCAACTHDLQVSRAQADPNNLSFQGPFLVRREKEYSVASLPDYVILFVGSSEKTFDWHKALTHVKSTMRKVAEEAQRDEHRPSKGTMYVSEVGRPAGMERSSDQVRAILAQAAKDPCRRVRMTALGMQKRLDKDSPNSFEPTSQQAPE